MITVRDIMDFLESVAPTYMKCDWDKVGLNCGHTDAPVEKILVALDPFDEAILEAKDFGAQLLITHHPLVWKPGFITDQDKQGQRLLYLIENGIAHINAHTNLDHVPGGVNDVLAQRLGLQGIHMLSDREFDLLRAGWVEHQSVEAFMDTVKATLGNEGLRYVAPNETVHKVAVGGGGCAGAFEEALAAGCDTFVTSDIKYNQFRDAFDLGLTLIDAGHFHTEMPVCYMLADRIAEAFPEIQVKVSENQRDVMKFY